MLLIFLSLLGLILCMYGLYLERTLKKNQAYKAACDLSDRISCSRTFLSPYSALLGVSNIYVGLLFYAVVLVLAYMQLYKLVFITACFACLASLYLAYIQYVKLRIVCLLCTSLYAINFLLALHSYFYI